MEIPECFYRISIKALVLNDTRDKFLICEEVSGRWDLPGGGLDFGTTPQQDLPREIDEEMGLNVLKVADNPSYFTTETQLNGWWRANVVYETTLEHLEFRPSDECINVRFVDKHDLENINAFSGVKKLAAMFDPQNHQNRDTSN